MAQLQEVPSVRQRVSDARMAGAGRARPPLPAGCALRLDASHQQPHLAARPGTEDQFLITPTASSTSRSLRRAWSRSTSTATCSTARLPRERAGFVIHSAIPWRARTCMHHPYPHRRGQPVSASTAGCSRSTKVHEI